MLGLLMSLYFVRVQICVHVVEYDWHMPTVDCCIEYIAMYNAVKGAASLAHVTNHMWRK